MGENERVLTPEEKEWIAFEEGWTGGYNAGIVDFKAVKREKEKLRKQGHAIVGDERGKK